MGISTQVVSSLAQDTINHGLSRSVAVANAAVVAQATIANGSADWVKAAVAENSTVTLTETRLSLGQAPATVRTEPVEFGQLQVSPPGPGNTPTVDSLLIPTISGLPKYEEPTRFQPGTETYLPGVQGDLVIPGGMARLEDVSLGAVSVEASPQAPTFTAPVLSTSASNNPSRPGFDTATQHYAEVVLVGSAQSVAEAALPATPPSGP